MALSDTQKQSIVFYLGWSGKTIVTGSTDYNSQVADALSDLTVDIETRVVNLLSSIVLLDTKLKSSWGRLAVKQISDIILNPEEIRMLKAERKRLIKELGSLLDIEVLGSGGVNFNVYI